MAATRIIATKAVIAPLLTLLRMFSRSPNRLVCQLRITGTIIDCSPLDFLERDRALKPMNKSNIASRRSCCGRGPARGPFMGRLRVISRQQKRVLTTNSLHGDVAEDGFEDVLQADYADFVFVGAADDGEVLAHALHLAQGAFEAGVAFEN
jgi:hypothetical protein